MAKDVLLKGMWRSKLKGLIIKKHWLDLILSGQKPWEIRGSNTKVRGTICLIESGTGMIKGAVELMDVNQLNSKILPMFKRFHCIEDTNAVSYKHPYAWVMQSPIKLDKPIPYKHPQGAVVWVNLPDDILEGVKG